MSKFFELLAAALHKMAPYNLFKLILKEAICTVYKAEIFAVAAILKELAHTSSEVDV